MQQSMITNKSAGPAALWKRMEKHVHQTLRYVSKALWNSNFLSAKYSWMTYAMFWIGVGIYAPIWEGWEALVTSCDWHAPEVLQRVWLCQLRPQRSNRTPTTKCGKCADALWRMWSYLSLRNVVQILGFHTFIYVCGWPGVDAFISIRTVHLLGSWTPKLPQQDK